jgi:rubrerythrin
MIGFFSKLFGGSKSEKDVKIITPLVAKINQHLNRLKALVTMSCAKKQWNSAPGSRSI